MPAIIDRAGRNFNVDEADGVSGRDSSSTLRGGSHGLDPGVGVRDALDHAISLEPIEAARQGRLVDRELVFELFQIRVARRTPQGIRRGHLPHNGGDLGIDARTASSRPTRELGPVLAEASALPS
jgi:hypothetical protein